MDEIVDDADEITNPMSAMAKSGSKPTQLDQSNELSNIFWDKRRFDNNRSGLTIRPSDVDDWPVKKKTRVFGRNYELHRQIRF